MANLSNKAKAMKTLYDHKKLTKEQLLKVVPDLLTEGEYFEITGETAVKE